MVFKVVLEPSEDGGYTAIVPSLPGCITEGESVEDTMINAREAIELYLEPIDEYALLEGSVVKELSI